jgi:polygalacturonase
VEGREHLKLKKIMLPVIIIFSLVFVLLIFNQLNTSPSTTEKTTEYVNAEKFGADGDDLKDDSAAIQKAINYSQKEKVGKVKLLGNKNYVLTKGLVLKEGVELELGQNTRLFVEGDFRVIEVEKNASITNAIFEITNKEFDSEVIYLNGEQKFWSWERTRINNVTIINSSASKKGTGISLFSQGANHFISFVNFTDINISGLHTGVRLEAKQPPEGEEGYSFINGNRFTNLTLDACVNCIEIIGSVTIPNECSGNEFKGLQIQTSDDTDKVLTVNGSDNKFGAMIWDVHLLEYSSNPIVEFTSQSKGTTLFSNLESTLIDDKGIQNYYTSPHDIHY